VKGLRSLVPPPSTDLKNIVIDEPSNQLIVKEILLRSIDIARKNRFAYIIMAFSNTDAVNSVRAVGPVRRKKAVPFSINGYLNLNLEEHNPTYIWEKVFNSKDSQRKYIRRFEQSGYEFRDSRKASDLETFYKHYAMNLNHIGAVPFDKNHFNVIFDTYLEDELRLTLLEKEDELAGGIMALKDSEKGRMYLRYMALNRNLPTTFHPSYALYWDAVNYAFDNGFKEICFGTNTNDPMDRSFQIKKGFGCRYNNNYGMLLPMNQIYGILYWGSRFFKGRIGNKPAAN